MIPRIEEGWLATMNRKASQTAFPELKYLYTNMTEETVTKLASHIPTLATLHLDAGCDAEDNSKCEVGFGPASQHMLAAGSNFAHLSDLQVLFPPDSTIHGSDLVLLATKCEKLKHLSIGAASGEQIGSQPHGIGLTDDTINLFSRHAPNLETFNLDFQSRDLLSFASVHSLGRHCPKLADLMLTCFTKWEDNQDFPSEVVSESIWTLKLPGSNTRERVMDRFTSKEIEDAMNASAEGFANLFPKLTSFFLEPADEVEQIFDDHMLDILLDRD